MNASTKFLCYHQQYGHVSPKKIQAMAKWGILPRCLATCPVPNCQACFYGKNTKKPWRSKTSAKEREAHHPIVQPGECISVDMMALPTPRLIAQMSGKPTCKRYCHAVIYVDQATSLGFV